MRKILFWIIFFCPVTLFAQGKMTPSEYLATYRNVAVEEMQQYGIPASITMAQGMLESGYGGSRLAIEGNNHFGIKCGGSWSGESISHNDDAVGECFRKYDNAWESYRDHSLFLQKERYKALFKLSVTDYKGWAQGLKAAGYATNPKYAELLIEIIEKYELYNLDNQKYVVEEHSNIPTPSNDIVRVNGVRAIVVQEGETLEIIAEKYGIKLKKLLKYNDMPALMPINKGDIIYLKSKKRSNKRAALHTVQSKESRHSLAQTYGIKESSLRRLNPELKRREAKTGDIIRFN